MKQSLGLLEVSGLALAISCADAMAKAASITLVGLEKTNGSGWTLIKTEALTMTVETSETPATTVISEIISCNLCLDPACQRQKGEPRSLCLHANKRGE